MKALIFNSGIGSRMGTLTGNCPKCLVKLANGETILSRQLRILSESGIKKAVITTGKYMRQIITETEKFSDISFTFVENPRYTETNYIYSMYLAASHCDDDVIMLHGDLVFEKNVISFMLNSPLKDMCMYENSDTLPEKDFKCRIENSLLRCVSVDILGKNCHAFQPIYKLSRETFKLWAEKVGEYVSDGKTSVYAENALNDILPLLSIAAIENHSGYIHEIDNEEDYFEVNQKIFFSELKCFSDIWDLPLIIERLGCRKPFIAVGRHCRSMIENILMKNKNLDCCVFSEYCENPNEKSIQYASEIFAGHKSDIIISVGGGSVIDTAKGVKWLSGSNVPHVAVPTTAGSGSEATKFSVYYIDGEKHSFDAPELLPEYIIIDSSLLYTLNRTQRMTTLLDALCHSAESLLSVNADNESRRYANNSIRLIGEYYQRYANGDKSVYGLIALASHYAGKAINISKTAAGHAMSYVLTSKYGIKHGQAAAVCLKNIFAVLFEENRLPDNLLSVYRLLLEIYEIAELKTCLSFEKVSADELSHHINADRLKNFSISLEEKEILKIYRRIMTELSESN